MDAILALFTQGVGLGFSAAASPGPFQAFLLAQAARRGVRRALPLALAPLLSDGPVVAVVLVVLSGAPPWLLRGLSVGGGLLLLWLAWGTLRAAGGPSPGAAPRPETGDRPAADAGGPPLLRAALVNAAGPGPWIFWSTVCGPILVEAWRAGPPRALAFLAGFYATLVGGNAVVVAVFGLAGRLSPRAGRHLAVAAGVAMAVLGALQLWRGLSGP